MAMRAMVLFAVVMRTMASGGAGAVGPRTMPGPSPEDDTTASCAIHSAEAVDELLDSAVYIMASIVRCQGHDEIRCALDVSSAIESVNGMINVILKAVQQCGSFETNHEKCGMAVGVLTKGVAGLSAGAAGIVAKCPNALNNFTGLETVGDKMEDATRYGGQRAFRTAGFSTGLGQCIINVKDTLKSVFQAISRIMTIKLHCNDADSDPTSMECQHNSFKVVAALTGMAEGISGAIARCSADKTHQQGAECAQMSIQLFTAISNVNRAADAMVENCHLSDAERLYLEDSKVSSTPTSNSLTLGLAALLPITAVLGFVGGTRLAKSRAASARDCEAQALVEME